MGVTLEPRVSSPVNEDLRGPPKDGERTAPRSHRPSAGLPGPTRTGADVDELLEAAKKGSASEEGENF